MFDYNPNQVKSYPKFEKNGFSNNCPKSFRFFFSSPKELIESNRSQIKDSIINCSYARDRIIALLKKTKIVYMTNTLTKRDYNFRIDSSPDGRRSDFFVYNCSLGAKISSNVSSFFAYEIYRQVQYVFDENQKNIRERLKEEIPEIPCPHELHIHPRILQIYSMLNEHIPIYILPYLDRMDIGETFSTDQLADLLSALCVASYILNVSKQPVDISVERDWNQLKDLYTKNFPSPIPWKDIIEKFYQTFLEIVKSNYRPNKHKASKEYKYQATSLEVLKKTCLDYLDFLNKNKSTLLSRFRPTPDGESFLLSLDSIELDKTLFSKLIEFVQKYRNISSNVYTIDFDWGLSSGEDSMLRLFSDLYYVFDCDLNIESNRNYTIYNNESHIFGKGVPCDTVLFFMDEADLTLHPEWQRRLIHILTAGLPSIYPLPNTKDIQIILSTHSPLLLGDVPEENITYMRADNQILKHTSSGTFEVPGETFGQNIHVILKDSFFLSEGTVGKFAANKINAAAHRLYEISGQKINSSVQVSMGEMDSLRRTVALVAPGILRNQLEQLLHRAEQSLYNEDNHMVERIIQASTNLSSEDRKRVIESLRQQGEGHD